MKIQVGVLLQASDENPDHPCYPRTRIVSVQAFRKYTDPAKGTPAVAPCLSVPLIPEASSEFCIRKAQVRRV